MTDKIANRKSTRRCKNCDKFFTLLKGEKYTNYCPFCREKIERPKLVESRR